MDFVMPDNRFDRGTIIKCKVRGCLKPSEISRHGLCRPHYMRYWKTGDPGPATFNRKLVPYNPKKAKTNST